MGQPARLGDPGRVRDLVGESVGLSGRTYHRAKAVVAAAETGDETAAELRERMYRTDSAPP